MCNGSPLRSCTGESKLMDAPPKGGGEGGGRGGGAISSVGEEPEVAALPDDVSAQGNAKTPFFIYYADYLYWFLIIFVFSNPLKLNSLDLLTLGVEKDKGETRCSNSKVNSSKPSTSCSGNNTTGWHGLFHLWKQKSLKRLASFPAVGFRRRLRKRHENLIGKGGYAEIYKGRLDNGQLIAVKKITRGTREENTLNFLCEMGILVHLRHPNIAEMIGVGNIDSRTYKDSRDKTMDWVIRYKAAVGAARGLEYLHEKCQRRIIHRDIKVANVLLTEEFEAQICDFGLAKWLPDELSHHTLPIEGTFGYLAPEYCINGVVSEKTDVFAFGVLVLELLTGRRAVDSSQQSLISWAKPLLEEKRITDLIDPSLGELYDTKQVVRQLRGEEGLQTPGMRRTCSVGIFDDGNGDDEEAYDTGRYLDDLKRHQQIAFDF
ncbi:receptor-like cytosolic serine/threonine-protein kinase RBK2 [Canna indica]|uniref:non-specific serine/threonine protein kinase n=1 Tax=Canna indica TaxID=4628 RepID=A0AAQ3JRV5_9LILI|nr:receptor-like cytosolic serine/threonine-protein kinase RBK2 [Canna indica]